MELVYSELKKNAMINSYIAKADESLIALGYTEHSFAHVTKVAELAKKILLDLGYSEKEAELAAVAGYLHDIGNVVNRSEHAQSGAVMAFTILNGLGAEPEDISTIITAIGNHDEATAFPVNSVAAALIIADKTDVRYTRVRNQAISTFDIHDRVNFAVKESNVIVSKTDITLDLVIDTSMCAVMDYFEIFLGRMVLCTKAAKKLNVEFRLVINGQRMI